MKLAINEDFTTKLFALCKLSEKGVSALVYEAITDLEQKIHQQQKGVHNDSNSKHMVKVPK